MSGLKLFFIFLKMGALAFGGGYTVVGLARHEFVERKKWITSAEMIDFLTVSQTLPGIMAVNFAAFLGNRLGGKTGGIAAVFGMIVPAVLAILLLANLITEAEHYPLLQRALNGVRIAVAVMILNILISQAKTVLTFKRRWLIAGLTGMTLLFQTPPVIPLLTAGLIGWLFYQYKKDIF